MASERVREAARDASLVLLPSHKSHIDYLVLSDMLYGHAMMPPVIAAGDNLSFWPIGVLLRRGGAFFIRRSFQGDALYPVLVEAYVRKLLAEGFTIEFFLEGGRSRIGKPLPPKYGLLSMVFESASKLRSTQGQARADFNRVRAYHRGTLFRPRALGRRQAVRERERP